MAKVAQLVSVWTESQDFLYPVPFSLHLPAPCSSLLYLSLPPQEDRSFPAL